MTSRNVHKLTPHPVERFFTRSSSGTRPLLTQVLVAIVAVVALLTGCSTPSLRSLTLNPSTNQTLAAGQTAQFTALGAFVQGKNAPSTVDVTSTVTWSSSNPAVATVSPTGLVTAVSAGTATITASANGQSGVVSATSNLTVTNAVAGAPGSGGVALLSLAILPGEQQVTIQGETAQFIAIGTFSAAPVTRDLTSAVTWSSSDVNVAKINASGLATYVGGLRTTIIAKYALSPASPVITATATVDGPGFPPPPPTILPTLTLFKVGATALQATVTASYTAPTGVVLTPINCAPGASGAACTATFPVGTVVTLSTPNRSPAPAPAFGGWSSNCTPVPADPYSCTIALPAPNPQTPTIGNVSVGAIFD